MSNIIGVIIVLVGAVAAGVSVWFVSKQHQLKQEQKHHQQTERRLLAQLEQERRQREEIERQLKQEQEHHQQTQRRLLAQLEQERRQREEVERQRQQEQEQREAAECRLLAQVEQERHQRQEIERHRLAQLEEVSIGDLENSLTNFCGEQATPTAKRTPDFVSKLRDLLTSGKWEKADKETLKIMLQVTGREKKGWLDVASIENFPCEELRAIDQLWLQSSNGRFGFSVQKRIWKSLGGNLKADDKIYQAFSDRIGWQMNKNWLQIDDLTFKPSATVGHLPATAVRLGGLSWGVDGFWWEKRQAYVFLLSEKDW